MNPYEAYNLYRAIYTHFTSDKYDYYKYNGKVKFVHPDKFKQRKDFYSFQKLAKQKNLLEYLVANMLSGPKTWSGDYTNSESIKTYKDWQKRQQSLSYLFKEEISKFADLIDALKVKDNQSPEILKSFYRKEICIETLIILIDILDLMEYWDSKIEDPLWKNTSFLIKKYLSFFDYDKSKMKSLLLQKLDF